MIDEGMWNRLLEEKGELVQEVKRLAARLRDAQDLLEDCGYCGECLWDRESIADTSALLKEPVWPSDSTPLCHDCHTDFVTDFEELIE